MQVVVFKSEIFSYKINKAGNEPKYDSRSA